MKRIQRMLYIGMGILLLVATILTGQYGLSKENVEIYTRALEMQDEMEELGFPEFNLSDYPVAFFDGTYDYVLTTNGDEVEIKRRKPVMDTFVGTAYPVEEHYEVLMPTLEKFQDMIDLFASAQQIEEMNNGNGVMLEENEYGINEQITTIWHEAFHAYQCTYYLEEIEELLAGHSFLEGDFGDGEKLIVEQVDRNPQIVALYERELELLKQAVLCEDIDTLKRHILEYKTLEEERQALLGEDILILENYYRQIEGTARYVEACAYRELYSEEAFQAYYVEGINQYRNGSSKYYDIGMAECLILDKLEPDWETRYHCTDDIMEQIYQYLGVEDGI